MMITWFSSELVACKAHFAWCAAIAISVALITIIHSLHTNEIIGTIFRHIRFLKKLLLIVAYQSELADLPGKLESLKIRTS